MACCESSHLCVIMCVSDRSHAFGEKLLLHRPPKYVPFGGVPSVPSWPHLLNWSSNELPRCYFRRYYKYKKILQICNPGNDMSTWQVGMLKGVLQPLLLLAHLPTAFLLFDICIASKTFVESRNNLGVDIFLWVAPKSLWTTMSKRLCPTPGWNGCMGFNFPSTVLIKVEYFDILVYGFYPILLFIKFSFIMKVYSQWCRMPLYLFFIHNSCKIFYAFPS